MKSKTSPPLTLSLPSELDVLAPDGSEIRLLVSTTQCSMAHGTLPPGSTSLAITHKTVEEVWYVLGGEADLWRKQSDHEDIVRVRAGVSLTIPLGVHFQFRTVGDEPFRFVMVTMPPWPGAEEAEMVKGIWND